VRDADLPIGVDPLSLLRERLDAAGLADAVAMMTSRDIRRHRVAGAVEAGTQAMAAVTLGLTNGVVFAADGSVQPASTPRAIGTINILAAVSRALDDAALLEAVSVVATARSAALLADGGTIAATGTDCIVVAAPLAGAREAYSGLHTAAGRSLAAAAYAATRAARAEWEAEFAPRRRA
jgi:adenosylcobinamide amidohydrolase